MTQIETVLTHLNKYGSISSMEAFSMYKITRLSEYIRQLRKNFVITNNWIVPKNNGKMAFVIYNLEKI